MYHKNYNELLEIMEKYIKNDMWLSYWFICKLLYRLFQNAKWLKYKIIVMIMPDKKDK